MKNKPLTCLLISDFNVDPLARLLEECAGEPALECTLAPIGQVKQTLHDQTQACWQKKPGTVVVWTQPYLQIPAFTRFLVHNSFDYGTIQKEVAEFAGYIRMAAAVANTVFVPAWTLPSYQRGRGILDYRNSVGITNTLMRMNLQLADELHDCENVYILNSQQWLSAAAEAEDDRMWYLGKIPYSRDIFSRAAQEIEAGILAIYGKSKKLLVLDLDNTLWGGTIGDLGIDGIKLGGIDPVGEAFVDFQRHILALKNMGIVLAIASKNDERTALEVFEKHPEMVLKKDDFVTWRINWQDKAINIVDMAAELNLGLQSVVFIDDNPTERARVSEALPEVSVPDWPEDATLYKRSLLQLRCFDQAAVSQEDRQRTALYLHERERNEMLKSVPSIEDWLHSLELTIGYEELSGDNLSRAVQLLNRVNQFNLLTRRMEKTEFLKFAQKEENRVWVFYAADRIGSYGMIGLASFEMKKRHLEIWDFVLSCRAFGRGIEKTMLYLIASFARANRLQKIAARYVATAKNGPCAEFLPGSGFTPAGEGFEHTDLETIKLPSFIQLQGDDFESESLNMAS